MTIYLPAPDPIDGDQLAAQVTAAGFTGVGVALVNDRSQVEITADGLADPMPPAEVRAGCATLAEVDVLQAEYEALALTANAAAIATISPIVFAHVPLTPTNVQ